MLPEVLPLFPLPPPVLVLLRLQRSDNLHLADGGGMI
jgi:hypothetical protein